MKGLKERYRGTSRHVFISFSRSVALFAGGWHHMGAFKRNEAVIDENQDRSPDS